MKGTPNVVRRGGQIHFRRQVPKRLVVALGRRELVASLKTSDFRVGKARSRRLYLASEELFWAVEANLLSADVIAQLVRDFYDLVAQIDQVNRLASPPISSADYAELLALLDQHKSLTKSELGRGDFQVASLAASVVIARAGLEPSSIERRQLEQALMRVGLEAISDAEARLGGDFSHTPGEPLLTRTSARSPTSPPAIQPAVDNGLPAVVHDPTVSKPEERLSVLSLRFLGHQQKGRLWDAQTVLQARKSYALFVELCGDRPLQRYERASAQKFKEAMQALPADYGKAAIFRNKSLLEIERIDKERGGGAERLSTRTVKRHFSALSGFFRWAIVEKLASDNPFTGFTFPSALRANEQRDMWTEEELGALFATPIWSGCLSPGRRSTAGDLVIRDEKFWLPLIAVLSGLRQEEAAQLHLEDVRKVEGRLVFDINGRPPRKLKNRTAVRKVPVHSNLIRLGLLDHIKEQQKAGEVRLFPGLTPGGADQRLGHAFSKWFARYRQDVGLYRKGLDFHSFRHTATTLMQRAGVGIAVIDELTGHVTPGETARYSHGSTMDQLAGAIEAIRITINIGPRKNSE